MDTRIEDMAIKIFNAFEDFYLDKDKRKIFEDLFDKYLTAVDATGQTEPYDAIVSLGYKYPADYEKMVKALKDQALISD
jgi:predicted urease superfamily metal-dependent hydrolase